jgi:hypothetical protein
MSLEYRITLVRRLVVVTAAGPVTQGDLALLSEQVQTNLGGAEGLDVLLDVRQLHGFTCHRTPADAPDTAPPLDAGGALALASQHPPGHCGLGPDPPR